VRVETKNTDSTHTSFLFRKKYNKQLFFSQQQKEFNLKSIKTHPTVFRKSSNFRKLFFTVQFPKT